jgi:hypothetical protein
MKCLEFDILDAQNQDELKRFMKIRKIAKTRYFPVGVSYCGSDIYTSVRNVGEISINVTILVTFNCL